MQYELQGASGRFPDLTGWHPSAVEVYRSSMDHKTWSVGGSGIYQRLGQPCEHLDCDYELWSIRCIDPDVLAAQLMNKPQVDRIWKAGRAQNRALRECVEHAMRVHQISAQRPFQVANLATNDLDDRVPVTLGDLRATGARGIAQDASAWEAIRALRDLRHVDAVELPSPSGWPGRDFVIFGSALPDLAHVDLGPLQTEAATPLFGPELSRLLVLGRIADAAEKRELWSRTLERLRSPISARKRK